MYSEAIHREALLSLFIENAPVSIAMFDQNMRYIRASRRWRADFGLESTEVIGRSHYEVFPEIPEQWKEIHRRCLKGATEKKDEDLFIRSDGTQYWLRWEIQPWQRSDGIIGGIIIFTEDITHQKKIEEELRAAVTARDEFLSIASHELKTPLTALSMQLQLIGRMSHKGSAGLLVSLSSTAFQLCQKMGKLIDELLDITRIRSGKLLLHKEDLDLTAAVVAVVEEMSEESKAKAIPIRLNAERSVVGRWDSARVSQIIANLLSNAIKYGEGKPIELAVTADPAGAWARLLVKDQGMGIPYEMQSKIFERFERGVSAEKIGGLGLGLYIVRQIVEAHGGFIRVESEVGKGSLFIVELPIK